MQKLALFMMVSVDGCFEGPDHDLSWHNVDVEFNEFADAQLGEFGALLFGHRTYDLMEGFWPTEKGQAVPGTAQIMNAMPKFVVSHKPFEAKWGSTTAVTGDDVIGQVSRLKEGSGKGILLLGSNMLCVSLMEAGLVDEFRLMANPVALGAGTPLFAGISKRFPLKLESVQRFRSGNVLECYIPAG